MHAADMATQPLRGTRLARRTGPVKGPRAAAHRVPPACRRVPTACAADSGDIELPTYDPRTVGQGLQVSCVALSCGAWGKGEDLQKEMDTFVVAVDGGITLFDAEGDATSEALLAQFVSSWEASPAAQLPGAQRPRVCTSIEIPAAATIAEKGADFGAFLDAARRLPATPSRPRPCLNQGRPACSMSCRQPQSGWVWWSPTYVYLAR